MKRASVRGKGRKPAWDFAKIVGMTKIDDEIDLVAHRRGPTTLRNLATNGHLTLRHFMLGRTAGARASKTVFWVDVRDPYEGHGAEGFSITESAYRELRAMGVPETSG